MSRQSIEGRYTPREIQRYEAVYGRNFISPGGVDSARRFLDRVRPDRSAAVLDVGCGIGGSAFHIHRTFGCEVDGIDLSAEMIRIARERCAEEGLEDPVRFHQASCLETPYPRESYGLVYSRDTFLHIADKALLFDTIRRHMAVGGELLFTDYILGPAPSSPGFRAYVEEHGYSLHTLGEYHENLVKNGLDVTHAEDLTDLFVEYHEHELVRIRSADLEPEEIAYLEERWVRKIDRARAGEQGWALFQARRR